MKITDVKVWLVQGIKYNWTLLKIYTDEGYTGVGEATNWPGSPIVYEAAKHIGSRIIGLDPMKTDFIWTKLYRDLNWVGPYGASMCAISGIDMALLDLKGKVLGVPCYELLGGAYRKDILLYDRYKDFADKLIAEADVICCLDFNALKRIDDMADAVVASPARKIMIDHHLYPEDFCKIVMSYPKISSTSELIFRLICRMGYFSDITKEGAECIYTGMMTDTGGFTYNSNNREIYFIISELLSKGIDKDDIYRKVYNTYSESRLRLMGYVLSNMTVYPDCNSALITLTKAEQSKFNYIKGDSEGFVNIPLSIKNVCFSCFLREDTEKPMIKISLRSVGTFPCNQLAAEFFNGGGHLNASGGEFFGTIEEAKAVFEKALEKYKPLLTAKS